ncbi:hypothetical protein HYS03_01595 [Candidatus Woesebacteria bacterium]|nr:hypothetical protein [Candidatus Woesebacteria bacterium]QQG47012.1 MAG: hypothetical protein HY044_02635 [Candidatus Woesebacteria bacterium]
MTDVETKGEQTVTPVISEPARGEEDTKPTPPLMKEPLTGEEDTKPVEPILSSTIDSPTPTADSVVTPEQAPASTEQQKSSGLASLPLIGRLFGGGK